MTSAASDVDAKLHGLVEAARKVGIRASPVEAIDAQRAAMAVGLERRGELKAALRSTIAKTGEEARLFDAVFEAFFTPRTSSEADTDFLSEQDVTKEERQRLQEALEQASGPSSTLGPSGAALAWLAGGTSLAAQFEEAASGIDFTTLSSPLQIGLFTNRLLAVAGFDEFRPLIESVRERLRDSLGEDRATEVVRALEAELGRARRAARQVVVTALRRREPLAQERARHARLLQTRFTELRRDELEAMSREVRRLCERLRGRIAVRRRHAARGRVDVRRTIREARKTAGVPVRLVHRRRRRDHPKLVVMVDISDSVRSAARFFFLLVHAIQEAFTSTRSFVFVRKVGETTHLFRERPVEEAMTLVYRGAAVPVTTGSDYGHAFGEFVRRFGPAVDPRTTLVILGDGRTNNLDPNVAAFAQLARQARQVLWLNPEPRSSWGFGDSAMRAWLPHVDDSFVAGDLAGLHRAVDALLPKLRR